MDLEYYLTKERYLWVYKKLLILFIKFLGFFKNDKKNGLGVYIAKNSEKHVIGNFIDNEMVDLSLKLNGKKSFENAQFCITKNKKTDICTNESEIKNIKVRQEYKNLKIFYDKNFDSIMKLLNHSKKN